MRNRGGRSSGGGGGKGQEGEGAGEGGKGRLRREEGIIRQNDQYNDCDDECISTEIYMMTFEGEMNNHECTKDKPKS